MSETQKHRAAGSSRIESAQACNAVSASGIALRSQRATLHSSFGGALGFEVRAVRCIRRGSPLPFFFPVIPLSTLHLGCMKRKKNAIQEFFLPPFAASHPCYVRGARAMRPLLFWQSKLNHLNAVTIRRAHPSDAPARFSCKAQCAAWTWCTTLPVALTESRGDRLHIKTLQKHVRGTDCTATVADRRRMVRRSVGTTRTFT